VRYPGCAELLRTEFFECCNEIIISTKKTGELSKILLYRLQRLEATGYAMIVTAAGACGMADVLTGAAGVDKATHTLFSP
jgi:hypothetical protein